MGYIKRSLETVVKEVTMEYPVVLVTGETGRENDYAPETDGRYQPWICFLR